MTADAESRRKEAFEAAWHVLCPDDPDYDPLYLPFEWAGHRLRELIYEGRPPDGPREEEALSAFDRISGRVLD